MDYSAPRVRRRSSSLSSILDLDCAGARDCISGSSSDECQSDGQSSVWAMRTRDRRIKKRCKRIEVYRPSKPYSSPSRPRTPLAPAFSFPTTTSSFRTGSNMSHPPTKTITTTTTPTQPIRRPRTSLSSSDSSADTTPPFEFEFDDRYSAGSCSPFSTPASSPIESKLDLTPPCHLSFAPHYSMTSTPTTTSPSMSMSMECDPFTPSPSPTQFELGQVEQLHKAAFADLRQSTARDEEGFVSRLRQWEHTRLGLANASIALDERPSLMCIEQDEDEDDEEVAVILSGAGEIPTGMNHKFELEELTMKLGGEVLNDYGEVRKYQQGM